MKKEYSSIKELIRDNIDLKETPDTIKLIKELRNVKKRGYITKKEFFDVCMWKSPRPKKRYLINSEEEIKEISKKVLSAKFEKRRIELLTQLKGVSIPTASALLTIIEPENYGIIDIRVWQTLYLYGEVKRKASGIGFNFNDWYNYLVKLRYWAKEFNIKARDIERIIFFHHKRIQEGTLYKT